ncbi:REP-associated tyrosine transposase [Luteibacter sp. UNCMF366Tsu5.1]|uniref:REP-associated tyrosine transposase n=1 Tax=Luteibacter sp. UNCMF366Tsu5.1 TaxID=1502758 RepID=UPI000908CF2D|nr:transposase [Luteibacter sp. UNCMF366Tsu5.1]SFW55284.1 REP element-mobilizing transposase RayT [Luteibacter sp. UNCMF366Tsu5.1]
MALTENSHRLRAGRVSEPGRVYFVTAVTWNRTPLFRNVHHARVASRICHRSSTWPHATCLAWVLMPDHWHGLIKLGDEDLHRVVGRYKAAVSRVIKRASERESPVWQRTFHDRALRREDDIKAAARYLIANPLRAGLVERIGDYPYWNAVWL